MFEPDENEAINNTENANEGEGEMLEIFISAIRALTLIGASFLFLSSLINRLSVNVLFVKTCSKAVFGHSRVKFDVRSENRFSPSVKPWQERGLHIHVE